MRASRSLASLLTVAVLGVACSDDPEPVAPEEPVQVPDQDEPDTSDPETDPQDDEDDPGSAAPSADDGGSVPDGPVLASADHPVAEHDATIGIELRAAETGELLRVSLTFTLEGDAGDLTLVQTVGAKLPASGMSGRVIDAQNLLEYRTVRPAVPNGNAVEVYEGVPVTLHFYVAAPVEPMESFDFLLDIGSGSSNWAGFVDVPYPTA